MKKQTMSRARLESWVERLRATGAEWCDIMESAPSLEDARDKLLLALDEWEAALRVDGLDLNRVDLHLELEALAVLRNLFSPVNEDLAGQRTFDVLWTLLRGIDSDEDVSEGFVLEFEHLFRAIAGQAKLGSGWLASSLPQVADPDGLPLSGRRAGVARSERLDEIAAQAADRISTYESGLDKKLMRQRARNRRRILDALGGTDTDWQDPAWQLEHVFRGEAGAWSLDALVPLRRQDLAALLIASRHRIPWAITPYYLSLFDLDSSNGSRDGQIRAQVLPSLQMIRTLVQLRSQGRRRLDFMRERDTSPVEHVTRRYASIAILKPTEVCPQICTYCQRNWEIADPGCRRKIASTVSLEPALQWFETHPMISEVLITGGDPLILENEELFGILERIAGIPHIMSIRIGSRYPVTMPMRITEAFAERLGSFIDLGRRNLSLVTHIESVGEITPDTAQAVHRLRAAGIAVYNQHVYTLEASRRFQGSALRVALRGIGIDPYYTFYTKGKQEHADQLVPVSRLLQERKEEARLLPGIYRTDEPVFNVPGLGKNHLRAKQDREWIAITPEGRRVYLFHPWEKGIAPAPPWVYTDVSIDEYLHRLEALGEDPADYESIWYYS